VRSSSLFEDNAEFGRGAAGLALFNRLLEPDIDLSATKLTDRLELSEPQEMRLPML
jgi:hypothetical protein